MFLTNASVTQPLQPFDEYDDRSLLGICCLKEAKQPWELAYPPQKTERAVRVHGVFTLLMFVLATASRLPCERDALGGEPVGWERWRRQRLGQTRDLVIILAEDCFGMFHLTEFALLVRGKLKDVPPAIGPWQEVLAKYGLPVHG